ncbi:MAG: BrnA antitoxin family protein [Brevundimonas sp.]
MCESDAFKAQLAVINAMTDEEIDTSDAPEITDWTGAVRGKFYRPTKQTVTIRLDADVVAWLKDREPKYQTAVNRILRDYMTAQRKSA